MNMLIPDSKLTSQFQKTVCAIALLLPLGIGANPISTTDSLPANTSIQVDTAQGTWSIASNGEKLENLKVMINDINAFADAKADAMTFAKTTDGLETRVTVSPAQDGHWVSLALSIHNASTKPIEISRIEYFKIPLTNALIGESAASQRFYKGDQIYGMERGHSGAAYYYSALYVPGHSKAWLIGFHPPIAWSSRIVKDDQKSLAAEINFYGRSIQLDPGETWNFEPLVLTAEYDAQNGIESYAQFYHPYRGVEKTAAGNGFNTWEYYRTKISEAELQPQLDTLAEFKRQGGKLNYFILDDGWFPDRGTWEFDTNKFPGGADGWLARVKAAKFEGGLWLAPFWGNKIEVARHQMTVQEFVEKDAVKYRLDPSDPHVQDYVHGQFRALSKTGYRYFKIDFLNTAYEGFRKKPFEHSKFQPEKVVGDFIAKIHEAIGPDAILLGCATPFAACAERVDEARVMSDITENWSVLTRIYRTVCDIYWTHGHAWLNDTDFFVERGPDTLKPGAFKGIGLPQKGERAYEGFTLTKARTWATIIFAAGGPVVFANQPTGMTPAGMDILRRLAAEGPGAGGRPLDWETETYCTKWVKHSDGCTYVILINIGDTPRRITVSPTEVPELGKTVRLQEVFTDSVKLHAGGNLDEEVEPFGSRCYRLTSILK